MQLKMEERMQKLLLGWSRRVWSSMILSIGHTQHPFFVLVDEILETGFVGCPNPKECECLALLCASCKAVFFLIILVWGHYPHWPHKLRWTDARRLPDALIISCCSFVSGHSKQMDMNFGVQNQTRSEAAKRKRKKFQVCQIEQLRKALGFNTSNQLDEEEDRRDVSTFPQLHNFLALMFQWFVQSTRLWKPLKLFCGLKILGIAHVSFASDPRRTTMTTL